MPRQPKAHSSTGYYHIMVRGNGKQILFETDSDRQFYIDFFHRRASEAGITLIAWCLMDNHAHMLVSDPQDRLSGVMASVNGTYAQRYNRSSQHVGHVFQDRYLRKPVETEAYFLDLVRYIHNNPEKANVSAAEDYRWSSYGEYVGRPSITDTSLVLGMLGGANEFHLFCKERVDPRTWLACEVNPSPETLMSIAREALDPVDPTHVAALSKPDRNRCLRTLKATGFSIRQIERITGIGKSTVSYVVRQREVLDEKNRP